MRLPPRALMNVLVYSGAGTSPGAVMHTMLTLKSQLSQNYDIIQIDTLGLLKEPWQQTTALLVMPGGRDLPYVADLGTKGTQMIRDYVHNGGAYLGLCAGAYFGSKRVEFEVGRKYYEVVGDRDLALVNATTCGSIVPGFVYNSESGAQAVPVKVEEELMAPIEDNSVLDPRSVVNLYVNGGPGFYFPDSKPALNERILAWYLPSNVIQSKEPVPAIVESSLGQGRAILSGPHFEYDPMLLASRAVPSDASSTADGSSLKGYVQTLTLLPSLIATNAYRLRLVRSLLSRFKLRLNSMDVAEAILQEAFEPKISPMYLTTLPSDTTFPSLMSRIHQAAVASVAPKNKAKQQHVLYDVQHDIAFIEAPTESTQDSMIYPKQTYKMDPQNTPFASTISILYNPDGSNMADKNKNRSFDIDLYLNTLGRLQNTTRNISFGYPLLYGEVVGSTQTLLEKNIKFQETLPDGLVCVGSNQLSGRGRGRNSWISQKGCLMFSFLLRHQDPKSVVFLQYLVGLAMVESIQSIPGLQKLNSIYLKWPNDIYGMVPDERGRKKLQKIGGILVSSSYYQNKFSIVIGVGINVQTQGTLCSLETLAQADKLSCAHLNRETLLAEFMSRFSDMYAEFVQQGLYGNAFQVFEQRYYDRWLHTNQVVTLSNDAMVETSSRARPVSGEKIPVKITGIDSSTGLLRATSLSDQTMYALQPDGNSFDMMQGLIKRKV